MNSSDLALHERLVATAREVAKELAHHESECDRLRELSPASVTAVRESGLFKVIQPRSIDGLEAGLPTFHAVGRALSEGCASTGWVYMVTGAHTWMLGKYPQAVQDEVVASDLHTIIPGSLVANGKAHPVDGGFRISGRWQFASGCDHGSWVMVGATQSNSSREDPKHVHALVPTGDFSIDDTWHTLGLRGTGSKDIVLDDVFVPGHRAMPTGTLFETGDTFSPAGTSFTYSFPVLSTLTWFITAPVLAMTQRIYAEFVAMTSVRRDRYDGSSKAKKSTTQMRLAESWAELRSAELLVSEIEAIYCNALANEQDFDVKTRVELKMRGSYAVTLCRRAADRLYDAAGANSIYERSPLMTMMNNLHTMSHHAIADFDTNATAFGSEALGLGPGTILF